MLLHTHATLHPCTGGGTPTGGLSVFSGSHWSSFLLGEVSAFISLCVSEEVCPWPEIQHRLNQVTSRRRCKRVGRICFCKDPSAVGKVCYCVEAIYLRVPRVTQSCGPSAPGTEAAQSCGGADFQRQGQTLILALVTGRVYGLVLKAARCFQGNALKIYRSK